MLVAIPIQPGNRFPEGVGFGSRSHRGGFFRAIGSSGNRLASGLVAVMTFHRSVGALLIAGLLAIAYAGCNGTQEPAKWTLWYIPNEPKPGVRLARPCSTYVFATAPVPATYAVAIVKGWTGARRPQGNSAFMHSGETFSGPLELGAYTIHDENNGYDLSVDVVYKIGTYLAAKARADADCPPAPPRR
jgi:hypothetical protein